MWVIESPDIQAERFISRIPVFADLKIAAGAWSEENSNGPTMLGDAHSWAALPKGVRAGSKSFIAKITGKSMEPLVPDGSWCVFGPAPDGSRNGKNLLVWHSSISDPDGLGHYSLKRYSSSKVVYSEESQEPWEHLEIVLHPLNKDYSPIHISPDQAGEIRVVAEFLKTLE